MRPRTPTRRCRSISRVSLRPISTGWRLLRNGLANVPSTKRSRRSSNCWSPMVLVRLMGRCDQYRPIGGVTCPPRRSGPPSARDYSCPVARASGGIGRRAGFRFLCPKGCGGSSPPSPTKGSRHNSQALDAISSLSGAAAANATLAWLGGGSLAAGGGGMAAGSAVLTLVAAAPAALHRGHHSRGRRFQAEDERQAIRRAGAASSCQHVRTAIDLMPRITQRVTELSEVLEATRRSCRACDQHP